MTSYKESFGLQSTKIVVLGESGVGKTCFVRSLCGKPHMEPASTIAASLNMTWHEYRAGTPEHRTEMVELWDIGGAGAHRNASTVFLDGAVGAILVHDLSNSKTEDNLWQWMALLDPETVKRSGGSVRPLVAHIESSHIPILIVGTKADISPHRISKTDRSLYEKINVDCRKGIAAGSTNSVVLARFLDSAIDRVRAPFSNEKRRRLMFAN